MLKVKQLSAILNLKLAASFAAEVCLVLALAFVAVQNAMAHDDAQGHSTRWGKNYLPNVEVFDQDGKSFHFYDDLIAGKMVVINFIYTTCTDICPLTTARLAVVQERLGDIVGRDVHMYSITIDPERDDVKALKRHADAFGVKPGWKFLTGRPEDIYQIRQKLGERSKIKAEHRHELLLGNAATGEWGRDSAFGDPESVVTNIRSMDPKWRNEVHEIAKQDQLAELKEVKDTPGEGLFIKACAACHTVGKGDRVGPDLNGVAARRGRDWLSKFITRPDKMFAQNDPIALALAEKFPGTRMPNLQITENDATDLIAYLEARTYAANADPEAAAAHAKQHKHEQAQDSGHAEHQHEHSETSEQQGAHEQGEHNHEGHH